MTNKTANVMLALLIIFVLWLSAQVIYMIATGTLLNPAG